MHNAFPCGSFDKLPLKRIAEEFRCDTIQTISREMPLKWREIYIVARKVRNSEGPLFVFINVFLS